jgi:hypothetical protein
MEFKGGWAVVQGSFGSTKELSTTGAGRLADSRFGSRKGNRIAFENETCGE